MKTIPKRVRDLSGQKFGRLRVLEFLKIENHRTFWLCKCECGNDAIVWMGHLISGGTRSCGCLRKEQWNRLPYGQSSINKLFYRYKKNAEKRGIYFNLSKKDFISLIKLDCFYCGRSPFKYSDRGDGRGNGGVYYTGIDRLNNEKGYTLDNSIPCCENCNFAKRNMLYEEFKSWIFDISDHMMSKEILHASIIE